MSRPIIFRRDGYEDLAIRSVPAVITGLDPSANTALQLTEAGELYTYQIGVQAANVIIAFNEDYPLMAEDYDAGFDWLLNRQSPGRQTLANWYFNVGMGALHSFQLIYGNTSNTVNLMNQPTLGFRHIPDQDYHYAGQIALRVQY